MENSNQELTIDGNKIIVIIALVVVAILAYVVWLQQNTINALSFNSGPTPSQKPLANPSSIEREKIGFKYNQKNDPS